MFTSQREMMQALMDGKRIRKDCWWNHCYLKMDEDGMIYDEEDHRYRLHLSEYDQFRVINPKDFEFIKIIKDIDLDKLTCVSEDIICDECPLFVNGDCIKSGLMDMVGKCQKYLED